MRFSTLNLGLNELIGRQQREALMGKVSTELRLSQTIFLGRFQFLIGKVGTSVMRKEAELELEMFQFLIGKVSTRSASQGR